MNQHPSHHRHVRAITMLIMGAIAGALVALGTSDDTPPTPTITVSVLDASE
ncbi:hypothetical protein [Microbispora bryophytorum]|uniref:hypothetical protein n=1 Tax=Microbispora bryophytorum TaxID=1460882 RepID=UPI0033E91D4B